MSEGKKLLAMDLDGTAVDSGGRMDPAVIRALNQLRAQGHVVCYATGRRDYDMNRAQSLYQCADYIILNTGSLIRRVADGAVLFNRNIDPACAKELIDVCVERQWQLYVIPGDWYGVNIVTPGVDEYAKSLKLEPRIYRSSGDFDLNAIQGFMVTRDRAAVISYIETHALPLECVCSEPECYDIMPQGVGKWGAIQYLAEQLGIPREHTVAMGNWLNDLEMIRNAGTGVAVGDAIEEVKAAADYVTPHGHNDCAVLDVCRHCFGLDV